MKIHIALLSAVILALSFTVEAKNKQNKSIKQDVSKNNPALTTNRENAKPQDVFFPQQDIVRFTVNVNTVFPDDSSITMAVQDSENYVADYGVLLLPVSYSPLEKSTRLIISCHGAGGGVTANTSQIERSTVSKYLVSMGYAVMDMNGLAIENMGGPVAVQAYLKGYYWVIHHYNIARDGVFIMGASMGGLTSNNLVYNSGLPVLAQAAFCPVLDIYSQAWMHPWYPTTRTEIAHWYNFKGYMKGQSYNGEYHPEKVIGFNPILTRTIEISGKNYKIHPIPVKIWQADKDPMVDYKVTFKYVQNIKNAGGYAELRTFDAVSHEPQDLGNDAGIFTYQGIDYKLKPAVREVALWFDRFN